MTLFNRKKSNDGLIDLLADLPPEVQDDIRSGKIQSSRVHARMTAASGSWFWLPCPVCGEAFGGQESGAGDPAQAASAPCERLDGAQRITVHSDGTKTVEPAPSYSGQTICAACQTLGIGTYAWQVLEYDHRIPDLGELRNLRERRLQALRAVER